MPHSMDASPVRQRRAATNPPIAAFPSRAKRARRALEIFAAPRKSGLGTTARRKMTTERVGTERLVTVFGGSGFVGRHVVRGFGARRLARARGVPPARSRLLPATAGRSGAGYAGAGQFARRGVGGGGAARAPTRRSISSAFSPRAASRNSRPFTRKAPARSRKPSKPPESAILSIFRRSAPTRGRPRPMRGPRRKGRRPCSRPSPRP